MMIYDNYSIFSLFEESGLEAAVGKIIELSGIKYEITSLLGAGNEGIVFEIMDIDTRNKYVVKLSKNPTDIDITDEEKEERLLHECLDNAQRDLTVTKNYQNAIRVYKKALEIDPNNVIALVNTGSALVFIGEHSKALEMYKKANVIAPNDYEILYNIAQTNFTIGEYNEAFKYYQLSLKNNIDYPDAWIGLGKVLGSGGYFKEALEVFNKALSIDPGSDQILEYIEKTKEMLEKD